MTSLPVGGVSWAMARACISEPPAERERRSREREGSWLRRATCLPFPCATRSAWYSFSHTRTPLRPTRMAWRLRGAFPRIARDGFRLHAFPPGMRARAEDARRGRGPANSQSETGVAGVCMNARRALRPTRKQGRSLGAPSFPRLADAVTHTLRCAPFPGGLPGGGGRVADTAPRGLPRGVDRDCYARRLTDRKSVV